METRDSYRYGRGISVGDMLYLGAQRNVQTSDPAESCGLLVLKPGEKCGADKGCEGIFCNCHRSKSESRLICSHKQPFTLEDSDRLNVPPSVVMTFTKSVTLKPGSVLVLPLSSKLQFQDTFSFDVTFLCLFLSSSHVFWL